MDVVIRLWCRIRRAEVPDPFHEPAVAVEAVDGRRLKTAGVKLALLGLYQMTGRVESVYRVFVRGSVAVES